MNKLYYTFDMIKSACVYSQYEFLFLFFLNIKNDFVVFESLIAGYYGDGLNAVIVFAVCFMPESNQPNYRYIMENLFK